MAGYINASGGVLILPDGTEIQRDAEANITADAAKASGVSEWIERGLLVPAAKPKADK